MLIWIAWEVALAIVGLMALALLTRGTDEIH